MTLLSRLNAFAPPRSRRRSHRINCWNGLASETKNVGSSGFLAERHFKRGSDPLRCCEMRPVLLACTLLWPTAAHSGMPNLEPHQERHRRFEVSLESMQLFGIDNPNRYWIAPQILSVAWQPFPDWRFGDYRLRGQLLVSFLGEAILRGPETYYVGGALRPRIVVSHRAFPLSFYADFGAGVGATNSDDTPFGQGQDLTFCILATGGLRWTISETWWLSAGFA